ncbi:hypothetical protein [Limibacillus halophilus]|uniref:hypothetical protein n=1 Tax=Limibacillus halophilus TaxID=1579333 RepID=UPI001623165A|nr:hypothetical protein [Limibacillus halophilus]
MGKSFPTLGILGVGVLLIAAALAPNAVYAQASDVVCGGCVHGSDIANGTIGPGKLIPGSINAATVANNSIGPNKLIPGSINATTIANGSVGANKLIPGSINASVIANGAVTAAKFAPGAVASALLKSTWIVSPVGTQAQNCTQLQSVLSAASGFATSQTPQALWVEPGVYDCGSGGISIPGNISIRGESSTNTTILGLVNRVAGPNVQLTDLAFRSDGASSTPVLVNQGVANLVLDSVFIRTSGSNSVGIFLSGGNSGIVVRDSTIDIRGDSNATAIFSSSGGSQVLVHSVSLFGIAAALDLWTNDFVAVFASGISGPILTQASTTARCIGSLSLATLNQMGTSCI